MHGPNDNIRVLLVDDERDFLLAIEPGLARRGFEVTLAGSGEEALDRVSSETFDIIVLDVKMPGIDGVDTFREIKRLAPGLPVIMLTGHGNLEQAFETSREGVYDYLAKPCDVEALASVAQRAVALSRQLERSHEPQLEGVRLLLVDDDHDFVESVAPALERRGLAVTTALDARAALQEMQGRTFDVALVDVLMPKMDGITLMARLRAQDPLMEVIFLTGHSTVEDARRGLKEGAFDYLTKPQQVEDLLVSIHAAYERRELRMQAHQQEDVDRIISERPD
ncbi:MAG: response regulator [Gemmatimonadota bacterium]|nr:MAG: response regulator [Gemmatimonadota bacterium]